MIADWRRQFGSPDLAFVAVQLAAYGSPVTQPGESGWAAMRQVQYRAMAPRSARRAGECNRHRRPVRHPSGRKAGSGPKAGTGDARGRLWRGDIPHRSAGRSGDGERRWRRDGDVRRTDRCSSHARVRAGDRIRAVRCGRRQLPVRAGPGGGHRAWYWQAMASLPRGCAMPGPMPRSSICMTTCRCRWDRSNCRSQRNAERMQ